MGESTAWRVCVVCLIVVGLIVSVADFLRERRTYSCYGNRLDWDIHTWTGILFRCAIAAILLACLAVLDPGYATAMDLGDWP
jgi:cytochrome b subunit of formate dehydrogenase